MNKVTLTVPEDMIRRAKAKAALEGLSLSAVVREFLKVWANTPADVQPGHEPDYWSWEKEPSP